MSIINDPLQQRQHQNLLFDFYGVLLTDKQRQIFAMQAIDDCSYAEIAKELDITPQAVADFLKRARLQLEKYEQGLGMVAKLQDQQQIIAEILAELDKHKDTEKIRKLLGKLAL